MGSTNRLHTIPDLIAIFDNFLDKVEIIYQSPANKLEKSQGMVVVQKLAKEGREKEFQ